MKDSAAEERSACLRNLQKLLGLEQVKIETAGLHKEGRFYSKCNWEPWRVFSREGNGKMFIFERTLAVLSRVDVRGARLEPDTHDSLLAGGEGALGRQK